MTRRIQLISLLIFAALALAAFFRPGASTGAETGSDHGFRKLLEARGEVAARETAERRVGGAAAGKICSLTVSLPAPDALGERDGVRVTFRDGERVVASKMLHAGDPDLYTLVRASGSGQRLEVASAADRAIVYTASVLEWPAGGDEAAAAEAEPNDSWREANPIRLGQAVWASADDKPYILPAGEPPPERGALPYAQPAELAADRLPEGGVDWFTFTYRGGGPKLAHFELDLLERDNVPVDVSVFTAEGDETRPYERGADPVTPPHEVQALPGNKFTTRVITPGTYYVRVDANHACYRLRTAVYDVPPYEDPRRAVRAGMDYLVSAGDSWHANTPRHGGVVGRVSSNHFETQLCVACHATHFTTRAELTAASNGYAVNKRASLEFLTERLANNPLPFYGHPEASWTRVISASGNVMSRIAALVDQYDREFTGEKRIALLRGVGNYLKLYYRGRDALPADETNGNTPLVSAYEVAWYSWRVFDELARAAGDAEARAYRDQVRALLEEDRVKNLVDLCYQTIAFAEIDRGGYAGRIRRNAERILELQRPDGQWAMLFDPESPAVEFQTYHCLYALARAGYAPDEPRVARSLKFLLARQQDFGGWFDPQQSYENFRTPFRESQFAVMALSEFFKGADGRGWAAAGPQPARLEAGGALRRLEQIDGVWGRPAAGLGRELIAELDAAEPLLRTAAAAALGRAGGREAVAPLARRLGDRSKLVQIAAAQALRRIASRDPRARAGVTAALASRDARARWGATRVFAQHFSALIGDGAAAGKLIEMLGDPYVLVRAQAAKSLVQWFYWTPDATLKGRIADAFVARMAEREHPWARRNLLEGFYSMADENVRYLYNNWIGNLAQKVDRDRAVAGHRAASREMAERIARGLETGNELQREGLLRGLTEFHLRSGGYTNAGRYTRIGNDIETVVFYPDGAPALERALLPMLASPDPGRRRQAVLAAYMVRDNPLVSLPLQVMGRLTDPDAQVRAAAGEFYRALPLKVVAENRGEAVRVLKELLASPQAAAQVAALERIKALGPEFARGEQFDREVRAFVLRAGPEVAPAALRSLADFPDLAEDAEVRRRVADALRSPDDGLRRAGAQLMLLRPELRALPEAGAAFSDLLADPAPARRKAVLDLVGPETPAGDAPVIGMVVASLGDGDEGVRAAALGAVRRAKTLRDDAAVKAGVERLKRDPSQRLRALALAVAQGEERGAAPGLARDAERLLDYGYFVGRVMPLLARRGADGNACVNCHATHTIFRLREPGARGVFTEEQLRDNYRSALKVVDLANPEQSLILRKPTGDASQEGLIGAKKTPHGGGLRWQGATDPAYQTVLEWINGARMPVTKNAGR